MIRDASDKAPQVWAKKTTIWRSGEHDKVREASIALYRMTLLRLSLRPQFL
jgi:hypothetical protein